MATRLATAAWADPALVEDRYRYRDGDVWLGRSASDNQLPIGYHDDRHVCLVSGSRAGKGTSSIINNLCLWPGSVVVVDPKGENATVTAPRRGKGSPNCDGIGQAVHILDPFKAAQVDDSYRSRFNPLDALDPDNEETVDEAGRIADAIVVMHEDSKDPFWDESARAMVKGLILHVITDPAYEGRRNLVTLRKLILRGDWEGVEALRASGETDIAPAQGLLWMQVARNAAFDGLVAGVGDTFSEMLLTSPKQFESVLQVANRNTEFIDSPAMQRLLESSDFELSDLKTRREGMSLYLCLPQRFMNTHYRWLRMMIALTVTEMEIVRARPATGFPVLMLLDEFAGLRRMEVIEHAVAQIAGYGVKLFFVLQSLEQLKAVYKDNWETFLSNSGLKIFFSLDDHFSREYVSKLVGETELIREMRSSSESDTESETRSHSTTKSSSRTVSTSQGTNRSATESQSRGINSSRTRSRGRSVGESWTPKAFLFVFPLKADRRESEGRNYSRSRTEGTSRGWSHSDTLGTSESTSESYTEGESETDGVTYGTSHAHTTGSSETVHKRSLVTPDEIGHLFARISDLDHNAYPGLALILISGERTVALRRVNYFEDYEFVRKFEPHPDFPALPSWKELTLECGGLYHWDKVLEYANGDTSSPMVSAMVDKGEILTAGDPVVQVEYQSRSFTVRSPYKGVITKFPEGSKIAWLFSLLYMDTGEPPADPFSDFAAFTREIAAGVAAKAAKAARVMWIMAALSLLLAVGTAAAGHAGLLVLVAPVAVYGFRKAAERRKDNAIVAACAKLLQGDPQSYWRKQNAPVESGAEKLAEATPQDAAEPQIAAPPADVPVASPETDRPATSAGEPRPESGVAAPEPELPGEGTKQAASEPEFEPATAEGQVAGEVEEIGKSVPALAHEDVSSPVEQPQELAAEQQPEETTGPDASSAVQTGAAETVPPQARLESSPRVRRPKPERLLGMVSAVVVLIVLIVIVVALGRHSEGKRAVIHGIAHARSTPGIANSASPGSRQSSSGVMPFRAPLLSVHLRLSSAPADDFQGGLAFSPDGHLLAFGTAHGLCVMRNAKGATESEASRFGWGDSPASVAFSPDGKLIASGDFGGSFRVWNLTTGAVLTAITGDKDAGMAVAFSPDGRLLATGGYRGTIEVWDVETGKSLWMMAGGRNKEVQAVRFTPDGQILVSSDEEALKLWNASTGVLVRSIHIPGSYMASLAVSSDGRLLAAGVDRSIVIWNLVSGKKIRTLVGHKHSVVSVVFSPDNRLLASSGNDFEIRIWDVGSGVELGSVLASYKNAVSQLAFSPDGHLLASGNVDGTLKLWHVSNPK